MDATLRGFCTNIHLQARESAVTILDKAVTPAWAGMQTGAEKAGEKIEPVIKKGVTPIYEAKNKVKDKIRGDLFPSERKLLLCGGISLYQKHQLIFQTNATD